MPSLSATLAAGPVVLDGGLSNQLTAGGHDLSNPLWTARLLRDDPAAIVDAHQVYLDAGASVVITSSYQATFEGFSRCGLGTDETVRLLRRSVDLARRAAERTPGGRPLWTAASVGPYGAMLADGSEYRGRYGLSVAELERFHRPRAQVLAQARPDILAIETVPDVDEAEALLRVVADLDVPAWLSFTVDGTRTRAGQPLEEAFGLAAGVDEVVAVGVNCCSPGDVDEAVRIAARTTGKPVVVYPNSGEEWDAGARTWRGRTAFEPERVSAWIEAGARLIGGCCRVGPDQIARLAEVVSAAAPRRP
jgi:homocysteine S-methyltransferase